MPPDVQALIIGGGPAGSAVALTLARAGMTPHLVERHPQARTCVCGGFLGWDALAALNRLGVDPWSLGARPISRFRLVAGRRSVEARLPRTAAGLSRQTLDTALLTAATRAGAIVTRGRSVRAADPLTRAVRFDDGDRMTAKALFLATGKHDLRGLSRHFAHSSVGLRASLPPSSAGLDGLADVVELHLFDQGYAGLLLQEDGSANLCLSVSRDRLAKAGSVPALLAQLLGEAPALAVRVGDQLPAHFDAVAGVPYGWRARGSNDGIFRVGDQAAVIASIAGDGIAIALASGTSAGQALLRHGPDGAPRWQRQLNRQTRRPVTIAEALRHAAAAPASRGALLQLLHVLPALGTQAAALTRISGD
ncbi:NAD(P)/FAD-dependent oxidoreductase [Sphingobium mellinum]|uniref:NAD(P)/FAD-dependent oxidoreductase n=1 Tax=Sphingobium mellinum TaxID=1387166 RepID=UPI0030EC4AC4